MKITIIGSGNVAEALAEAISGKGSELHLHEIYSRNRQRGAAIAAHYGTAYISGIDELSAADLYIIAVSDSAVAEISERLTVPGDAVVAHVSGGQPIDILSDRIVHKAVIYPLQTFTSGRSVDFSSIPLFLEYATPHAEEVARQFSGVLSGSVYEADSERRNRLHLAAVFACNFTNHLYHIAAELASQDGLSFEVLKPIIHETAAKALSAADPSTVQTGPAARHDGITIQRHLALLASDGNKKYSEIYKLLSDNIWETLKRT